MRRKLPENPVIRFFCLMVRRYLRHGVGAQAAALAFYLLFMIFPFAIFLSALLGLLHLDVAGIVRALGEVMPREAVELIGHAVGGVCPFAVKAGVKTCLDHSLRRFSTVFPACGSSNSAIELTIAELEKYSSFAAWIDICKGWQ